MRVAIKYCGACNPCVDLTRLGQEVQRRLEALGATICPLNAEDLDLVAILNGCPRACANRPDVWLKARGRLVLAGTKIHQVAAVDQEVSALAEQIMGSSIDIRNRDCGGHRILTGV